MLTSARRETNSIACHGAPGVSNTAGAALWTIDFTLQAASLGIKELFFHEGIGYKYNFVSIANFLQILPLALLTRDTLTADATYLPEPLDNRWLPPRSPRAATHPAAFLRWAGRERLRRQLGRVGAR